MSAAEDDDISALTGGGQQEEQQQFFGDDDKGAGGGDGGGGGGGVEEIKGEDGGAEDNGGGDGEGEDSDDSEEGWAGMEVDGFECPDDLLPMLLPMEFEEMVNLFKTYDANGSGTIDKHEARKILQSLGMDASLEKAEELLNIVDADKSGEIDFSEFCHWIVMIKDGDERVAAFNDMLSKINNTPLGDLEHQAGARGFKLKFETIEVRQATATQPQMFVVELIMTGDWFDRVDGVIVKEHASRRFQGIGVTNREAKYAACKLATAKLRQMMPGTKYQEGTFPDEWIEWIDENLARGVDPFKIMSILAAKGFHPYASPPVMQRVAVWLSFDEYLAQNPDFDPTDKAIAPSFRRWIEATVEKGIDGPIIVQVLADRNYDIRQEYPHYCEKLLSNEFGTLLGRDGKDVRQFSFWTAANYGFLNEVKLFCTAAQPVNAEAYYSRTGQMERALALAADSGHLDVVKVLLEFGADATAIDNRGRSALHRAAINGSAEACKFMVEKGALIFDGDFSGNTALHFAASFNRGDVIEYLAWQGQEFTRIVTSDKVRAKAGMLFNELCAACFVSMIDNKLRQSDVRRFEKAWLHEACVEFRKQMDKDVRRFIPHTSDLLKFDVLARFDPRPETGVFVTIPGTEQQEFVPTIPSPVELAVLMRFMFRQAAVDSINSMKRTALHVACDSNRIFSHESVIQRFIDVYGCNTQLRDSHGRRPIELLMLDREFAGKPSATREREEFFLHERQRRLQEFSDHHAEVDRQRNAARRAAILEECSKRSTEMLPILWECVRNASICKRKFGRWEMYEDPESLNRFYCYMPAVALDGERYKDFSWRIPLSVKAQVDRTWAYTYQFFVRSVAMKKYGPWQQYRCKFTGIDVYYDAVTDRVRFTMPKEASWAHALRNSVVVRKLGFTKEYEELQDATGNLFYRHIHNGEMMWDKPVDAVEPTPADMFCTAVQFKRKEMEQKLFTCEQCNRGWKASDVGAKVTLRMCEPCIERCHKGHKGIRQLKDMSVVCLCESVCRVVGHKCKATHIGPRQALLQSEALDMRIEVLRRREHNAIMPPVFANVPDKHPDGRPKRLSGWLLCRRPPLKGAETMGEAEEDQGDDETSATGKSTVSFSTQSGSVNRYEPVADSVQEQLLFADNYPYVPPPGLPPGWIEVLDVEEPDELPRGTRVLVDMREKGPGVPFCYGNIVTKIVKKKDVYLVRADLNGGTTMKVARSRIETIGRQVFYTNLDTGESAWTVDQAEAGDPTDGLFPSRPMQLPGKEWLEAYEMSEMRRAFQYNEMEEVIHLPSKMVYYVDGAQVAREKAACVLQKFARNRLRLQWGPQNMPFQSGSTAFTLEIHPAIEEEMKIRGAWSYLRRRATNMGDFYDAEGDEWEEYIDNLSSEYFYWQEGDNRYQWDKPPLPEKAKVVVEYLRIEEEVYFRFPGKRFDEIVIVKRLRFDDQTGQDMYDIVHKYDANKYVKWVARMRLKKVPQGGDVLAEKREERKWRGILQRRREADERKKRRLAELKLQEELKRLEDLRTGKLLDAGEVGDSAKMIQGRKHRQELETKVVQDEIDAREGVARRDRMREIVKQIKEASPVKLSRSDIMSLERVTEVKLVMEDRINKRNALAFELMARKKAIAQRTIDSEAALQADEAKMTTPRSIIRRRVMRRVHFAMRRQDDSFMICEWGCQDWVKTGFDMIDHQLKRCSKRILGCPLLCTLKMSEEDWMKPQFELTQEERDELAHRHLRRQENDESVPLDDSDILRDKISRQQYHETEECPKRMVPCPRQCLEWVVFEKLGHHMDELCTKRPAAPIFCRLGCGTVFGGLVEKLIESEDERMMHETEECEFRVVRCNWQFPDGNMCAAQMMARDRNEHKEYHLRLVGVTDFLVSGTHLYKVPKKCYRVKIQLWGAGGGSGYFLHRQGADGGGGAYVEAVLAVEPYDVLEIVIGSGGFAGVSGAEIESTDIDVQRAAMKIRRDREMFMSREERLDPKRKSEIDDFGVTPASCGTTMGGVPGGGEGYGGGGCWACGGGGGYSIVSKRTPRGNQALLVAAGGGGGGSLHGLPGGNMDGYLPGTRIDPICGGTGTSERGGAAGDSGSSFNAQWPAEEGKMWQGGNASEFGAGGGGGYYGGGGGGTRPGLAGGGGGGASYVYVPKVHDFLVMTGNGRMPGGLKHDPPNAVGCGDWDKVGGLAGEGGSGSKTLTRNGNSGACRILKPGYY